ncbi:hypothetical protein [Aeromonas jandaei]
MLFLSQIMAFTPAWSHSGSYDYHPAIGCSLICTKSASWPPEIQYLPSGFF